MFSKIEIENAITDQDIAGLRILYLAMFLGVFFLLVAVFFVSKIYDTPLGNLNILVYKVLALVTLLVYFLFGRIEKIALGSEKLKKIALQQVENEKTDFFMEKMLARMYLILRVAVLEGAALISCIALFLSARQGLLAQQKIYWLFILPSLVHFAYIFINFPTKELVADVIRTRILPE